MVPPIFLAVLGRKEQLDPFTVVFIFDDFSHNVVKVTSLSYIKDKCCFIYDLTTCAGRPVFHTHFRIPKKAPYTSSEPPEKHTLSYLLATKTDALSLHIWEEVCYKLKNINYMAYIYLFDK